MENLLFSLFRQNLVILVIFTQNVRFSLKSCTPDILVTGLNLVLN